MNTVCSAVSTASAAAPVRSAGAACPTDTVSIVALAGNPNVGKSVVFRCLTGLYAEVSNYPGTTVDIARGTCGPLLLCDTPGVFGLSDLNEEETVARRALMDCEAVINVIDGTTLHRDLFLTLQLCGLQKPMLVVVNMMDLVEKERIQLDLPRLSAALGLPVVAVAAGRGSGIDTLRSAVLQQKFCLPHLHPHISGTPSDDSEALEAQARTLARQCSIPLPFRRAYIKSPDRYLLHPLGGFLLFASLLLFLWFFLGQFLSQTVVGVTQGVLMDQLWYDGVCSLLQPLLSADSLAGCLLYGEYGLLTMVPSYLLGLLLPLVAGFYFVMSLLEDSGLLPRMAVLSDRLFSHFGLNGKAVIPMLSGFGCVTMALISTRMLGSRRERLIAALLLCTAIPCSAQCSIIMAVAASLPLRLLLFYLCAILLLFIFTGLLANALLPGDSSPLFLSLPPLRFPQLSNVLHKTLLKSRSFLADAGPLFLAAGAFISLLNYTSGFSVLHRWLLPLTDGMLHLPPQAVTLLLMCLIKRDLGAAYLFSMIARGMLSPVQITVCLITTTLFVPCFASLAVLAKEQGAAAAAALWLFSLLLAFAAGSAAAAFLPLIA